MKRRTLLTWFALGHLAIDWPIAALWLIVPAAGLAMELSPSEVGLLFTLFTIGGALAYVPAGFLADHVSNRGRLLLATFWWVAIGYALAALAPGFWSLALLLALAGMGDAAWHPIATGVLTRDNKEARAQALGLHAIGGSFAEVLAPLAAGFLLAFFDWRSVLVISVVPTILAAICFFWVAPAVPVVERKLVSRQSVLVLLATWRQGAGLRIVAMMCLYNMALIAMLSMVPLYLSTVNHLDPETVGLIFAGLLVTGALAQPLVGSISDKIGRRPVLLLGNLAAGLAIAVLVFEPGFWVMIALMAIGIGAMDAIRATMLATAVDHSQDSEGTTLGFAFAVLDGVGAVGAVLAGLAAGVSWEHMFALAAALSLGAAALSGITVDLGHRLGR